MEKQDLVEIDSKMQADLEAFRKQFNVEPERFNRAVRFCELVLDGTSKTKAYAEVFEVSKEKAGTISSQFHRTKWVQELLLFLRPNEHSLYFGERKRIIQAGMAIIDDPRASNRDKTEAMKALQPFIKQEIAEKEDDVKGESEGQKLSDNILKQLDSLAKRGKMIGDNGAIIDIELID